MAARISPSKKEKQVKTNAFGDQYNESRDKIKIQLLKYIAAETKLEEYISQVLTLPNLTTLSPKYIAATMYLFSLFNDFNIVIAKNSKGKVILTKEMFGESNDDESKRKDTGKRIPKSMKTPILSVLKNLTGEDSSKKKSLDKSFLKSEKALRAKEELFSYMTLILNHLHPSF